MRVESRPTYYFLRYPFGALCTTTTFCQAMRAVEPGPGPECENNKNGNPNGRLLEYRVKLNIQRQNIAPPAQKMRISNLNWRLLKYQVST